MLDKFKHRWIHRRKRSGLLDDPTSAADRIHSMPIVDLSEYPKSRNQNSETIKEIANTANIAYNAQNIAKNNQSTVDALGNDSKKVSPISKHTSTITQPANTAKKATANIPRLEVKLIVPANLYISGIWSSDLELDSSTVRNELISDEFLLVANAQVETFTPYPAGLGKVPPNESIYRTEMLQLLKTHRTVVAKQQEEINNLKALLKYERSMNITLVNSRQTPPCSPMTQQLGFADNHSPAESSTPKLKTRSRFIPLEIDVSVPHVLDDITVEMKEFKLGNPYRNRASKAGSMLTYYTAVEYLDTESDKSCSSVNSEGISLDSLQLQNVDSLNTTPENSDFNSLVK